jgi:transcriptional regulator with XRE-family HTH domain
MEKLASFIKTKGMTQASFAESVGITQSTLSKLCAGPKGPSLETALAIERETGGKVAVADWPKFSVLAGRLSKAKRTARMGKSSNDALPDGVSVLATKDGDGGDALLVRNTGPGGAA